MNPNIYPTQGESSIEHEVEIITILTSWNIKTNFIEKISHLDKLIVTIRKGYIFSLN